jgi:hypothetical protein
MELRPHRKQAMMQVGTEQERCLYSAKSFGIAEARRR